MATSVVMPALEMAQETGKLVSWLKKEGEQVRKGEMLLEVETDKAVVEVEAGADGILAGITAQVGDVVPVGQTMAHRLSPALLSLADDGTVGVKLVSEDGIVSFAPVSLVGNTPDGAVFVTGLPERVTVISVGQDYVGAGQKVKAVTAGPSEAARR